ADVHVGVPQAARGVSWLGRPGHRRRVYQEPGRPAPARAAYRDRSGNPREDTARTATAHGQRGAGGRGVDGHGGGGVGGRALVVASKVSRTEPGGAAQRRFRGVLPTEKQTRGRTPRSFRQVK